jgi:LysR family transcriptional regulator, transcriptional activator of the cysJI operon
MIDFRYRTFLVAAEVENLTRASESLGLTQPAVSQHIAHLEKHYGCPLFGREGRRLKLTEAGLFLRDELRELDVRSRAAERELMTFTEGRRHFSLGATLTVGEYILPRFIGLFKQKYPSYEIGMTVGNTRETADAVRKGRLDFGAVEGFVSDDRLNIIPLGRDEMVFVCSPASEWADLSLIGRKEALNCPMILREEGSGTLEYWERRLGEWSLDVTRQKVVMRTSSLTSIKQLVESGLGCTVISREAVSHELRLGTLCEIPLEGEPLLRQLNYIFSEKTPSLFFRIFREFIDNIQRC